MNFNPEFHWQTAKKHILKKRIFFIVLGLILALSVLFIFQRYYFVSGRSIDLDQLIPEDSKVVFNFYTPYLLGEQIGLSTEDSRFILKDYFGGDVAKSDLFFKNIEKNIYWIEDSINAQSFLFKTNNIENIEYLFSFFEEQEIFKENGKSIYELNVDFPENKLLNSQENKVYLAYLNKYIFCISNDLDLTNKIVDKYKEASKIGYLKSVRNELSDYFKETSPLKLEIRNYEDIQNSQSWIKNLSWTVENLENKSLTLKLKTFWDKLKILVYNSNEYFPNFNIDREINETWGDFLIYYNNRGIYDRSKPYLSDNIDYYLLNNIEELYNIDFEQELSEIDRAYSFLLYPDSKFLLISEDSEKLTSFYKKILAHLEPQTRKMILPDNTEVQEYYMDPDLVQLKEKEDFGMTWYYGNFSQISEFYLLKLDHQYILSNFREKVLEISQKKDKFNTLIDLMDKNSVQELLTLNLKDIENKEDYFKLSTLFSAYNRLNFVNFSEIKGETSQIKLFFELIH